MIAKFDKVQKLAGFDRHHIVQDAAIKGIEGHFRSAGLSLPIVGGFSGSPHSLATAAPHPHHVH